MSLSLRLVTDGRASAGGGSPLGALHEVGGSGQAEIRIGRHPDNDLALPFSGVSAQHARLFRKGAAPEWWLEDLGSSNGTWLGTRRLAPGAPHPVKPGDQLRLGDLVLVVDTIAAPATAAESTATIGRRLIGGGAPAPSASSTPTATSHSSLAPRPADAPSRRDPRPTTDPHRRPADLASPARPTPSQEPGRPLLRVAVIAFAITMTILAVSGLIALAVSLG
jgi:predicted component of type VI protein secretion system